MSINFYFHKSIRINKHTLLKYFKVSHNSYMETVLMRLYDYYLADAVSLTHEYRKCYKKEFCSFNEFLSIRHNFTEKEFDGATSNLWYTNIEDKADMNISELIKSEDIKQTFYRYLQEYGT